MYTPGPWKIFVDEGLDPNAWIGVDTSNARHPMYICKISTWGGGYHDEPQAKCNAELIAASPDLLKKGRNLARIVLQLCHTQYRFYGELQNAVDDLLELTNRIED